EIRLSEGLGRLLFIVHIKSDVVNPAQFRALPGAEFRSTGFAIFQNSEINVAVAEPNTLFTGVAGSPIELGQAEMFLVEFCGLRGIISDQCDVPDASHWTSP